MVLNVNGIIAPDLRGHGAYLSTITADTLIVFGDRDLLYPVSMTAHRARQPDLAARVSAEVSRPAW
jgi:pimeloyl-ACP methyl ester carboxylesterase